MKLPHSDLLDLTTQALQEDLTRRVRESIGAPVMYGHATVQALLSKLDVLNSELKQLRASAKLAYSRVEHVESSLLLATSKAARMRLRSVLQNTRVELNQTLELPTEVDPDDESW